MDKRGWIIVGSVLVLLLILMLAGLRMMLRPDATRRTIVLDPQQSAGVATTGPSDAGGYGSMRGPVAVVSRETPKHGLLGAAIMSDNDSGLPKINEVLPGSGAEAAGVKVGDFIVSVRGQPVKTLQAVLEALKTTKPGDTALIVVRR